MTEFYHHGVKGQKWGVTHDRPKARRKYVTNNGEGVHRRGRHKISKEQRMAKEIGASMKALSQHPVTTHEDLGFRTYDKEALANIMKHNPPPSPNAPGYSQYFYDLLTRPDLLCSTESYETQQDPNAEGQPPYYISDEDHRDEYGNLCNHAEVEEDDPLKKPQIVWYVRGLDGNIAYTAEVPPWHAKPNVLDRAQHAISKTVEKCKNVYVNKLGRKMSSARYSIMRKIWKKYPNLGVHKVKDPLEDL